MNKEQIMFILITIVVVGLTVMFFHQKQKNVMENQISAFHELNKMILNTYEFASPAVKKLAWSKLYGLQIVKEIEKEFDEIKFNYKSHFINKTIDFDLNSLSLLGYNYTNLSQQEIQKIQLVNSTDYKLALSSKIDQIAEESNSTLIREIEYTLITKSKFNRMRISSSQKDYTHFNEEEKAITKDLTDALLILLKELDKSPFMEAINPKFEDKALEEELKSER